MLVRLATLSNWLIGFADIVICCSQQRLAQVTMAKHFDLRRNGVQTATDYGRVISANRP